MQDHDDQGLETAVVEQLSSRRRLDNCVTLSLVPPGGVVRLLYRSGYSSRRDVQQRYRIHGQTTGRVSLHYSRCTSLVVVAHASVPRLVRFSILLLNYRQAQTYGGVQQATTTRDRQWL